MDGAGDVDVGVAVVLALDPPPVSPDEHADRATVTPASKHHRFIRLNDTRSAFRRGTPLVGLTRSSFGPLRHG